MDDSSTNSQLDNAASASASGPDDKEVLAPAEGPREHLINTAVKFLQNPKVISSPLYQKKAFLANKGLTQEEINIAVERGGVKESADPSVHLATQGPPGHPPGPPHNAISPMYAPIPPQSTWARMRDLTMTSVIIMGVSYAVYRLFEKYVRPLWLGKTEHEKRMERLESQILDIQKSVTNSLAELNKTLAGIQINLQNQQQEPRYPAVTANNEKGITDLKADIASLKGLLLSKNQFPPAPSISPVLPEWQRAPPSTQPTVKPSSSASETSISLPSKASSTSSSSPPPSKLQLDNGPAQLAKPQLNRVVESQSMGGNSAATQGASEAQGQATNSVTKPDIPSPLPSLGKGLTHSPVLVSGQASNVSLVSESDQHNSEGEEVD